MSEWQPIETAPKDGTWFLVLIVGIIIGFGRSDAVRPELMLVRRKFSNENSDGYWSNTWDTSIADHTLAGTLWANIDALPIRAQLRAHEDHRIALGGIPHDLPVPYGAGTLLPEPQETS